MELVGKIQISRWPVVFSCFQFNRAHQILGTGGAFAKLSVKSWPWSWIRCPVPPSHGKEIACLKPVRIKKLQDDKLITVTPFASGFLLFLSAFMFLVKLILPP